MQENNVSQCAVVECPRQTNATSVCAYKVESWCRVRVLEVEHSILWVQQQRSFCRRKCCGSMERHRFCHWQIAADVVRCQRQVECHPSGTEELAQTAICTSNSRVWSGFAGAPEASATSVGPAWCGRVSWPQTRAWQQRSGLTVFSALDCRSSQTSASCNSPGDRKWTPGIESWQHLSTVTEQLGGVAWGSSSQTDTEPWRVLRVIAGYR